MSSIWSKQNQSQMLNSVLPMPSAWAHYVILAPKGWDSHPSHCHLSTHSSSLGHGLHFPHAALLDRNRMVLASLMSWRQGFPLTSVPSGCLYRTWSTVPGLSCVPWPPHSCIFSIIQLVPRGWCLPCHTLLKMKPNPRTIIILAPLCWHWG